MTTARRKPDRTCDVCGGPIKQKNAQGVCARTPECSSEYQRRWYLANRTRVLQGCRRWSKANPDKRREAASRYRAAHPDECRAAMRAYHAVNRERINEHKRHYDKAHRKQKREYERANYQQKASRIRATMALRGSILRSACYGHLNHAWQGGRVMYCAVPGCHRMTGWRKPCQIKKNKTGFRCLHHQRVKIGFEPKRNMPCAVPGCHRMTWKTPTQIKMNKTGFRCSVHQYVGRLQLAKLKEQNHEDERKEVRSSVA